MGQWLYIDKDYDELSQTTIAPSGEVVDGRFNVTLGLEPMNDNVFEYLVCSILKKMYSRKTGYLSIAYVPARPDRLSCIQCYQQINGEGFSVEIVEKSKNWRGYNSYKVMDLGLNDTVALFRKTLVKYRFPDITDWVDITDSLHCDPEYCANT